MSRFYLRFTAVKISRPTEVLVSSGPFSSPKWTRAMSAFLWPPVTRITTSKKLYRILLGVLHIRARSCMNRGNSRTRVGDRVCWPWRVSHARGRDCLFACNLRSSCLPAKRKCTRLPLPPSSYSFFFATIAIPRSKGLLSFLPFARVWQKKVHRSRATWIMYYIFFIVDSFFTHSLLNPLFKAQCCSTSASRVVSDGIKISLLNEWQLL